MFLALLFIPVGKEMTMHASHTVFVEFNVYGTAHGRIGLRVPIGGALVYDQPVHGA